MTQDEKSERFNAALACIEDMRHSMAIDDPATLRAALQSDLELYDRTVARISQHYTPSAELESFKDKFLRGTTSRGYYDQNGEIRD